MADNTILSKHCVHHSFISIDEIKAISYVNKNKCSRGKKKRKKKKKKEPNPHIINKRKVLGKEGST